MAASQLSPVAAVGDKRLIEGGWKFYILAEGV